MEHTKTTSWRIEETLRKTHIHTHSYEYTYERGRENEEEKTCFKQQAAYLNRVSNGNSINAVLRAMNTIDLNFVCMHSLCPRKTLSLYTHVHTHIAEYYLFFLLLA